MDNSRKAFRKNRHNESGMILVIAATFVLMMSIVVIGILSRNVSQALSANAQFKRIQAEQLARGAWWFAHDNLWRGDPLPANYSVTIQNVTYTITYFDDGLVGPNGTRQIRVNVSY